MSSDSTEMVVEIVSGEGAAKIFCGQVRLLYRLSRSGYGGTLAVALIAMLTLWNVTPTLQLVGWFALVVAITAARFLIYLKYAADEPSVEETAIWANRFVVGAMAMGAMWGALGSIILPQGEIVNQLIIIFLVACVVVAALAMLTPVKSAFLGFTVPALLPLIVAVFAQGESLHVVVGAVLAVFAVVMFATYRLMHDTHVSSLRVRFENSGLVERLSAANHQAMAANQQLVRQLRDQKETEETLKQSSDRLEALIDASPLAIIVQNSQSVILRWNAAAEKMFGWAENEVVGKISPVISLGIHEQAASPNDTVLNGQPPAYVEDLLKRKDGSQISVSISTSLLCDRAGAADDTVIMIADISERKKSERLRQIEHAVTRLLSESRSAQDVMPQVLQAVGEVSGLVYGARWVLQEQRLRCAEIWHVKHRAVTAFAKTSLSQSGGIHETSKGGLLGTVWDNKKAAWINDVGQDGTVDRADAALRAGLHSAFAVPVMVAGKFCGALEFYAPEVRARDDALLNITTTIASQVGQFIARREAESRLSFLANHDSLTGLLNRVMFNQQLIQALARAQRYQKIAAVLFFDLDRLKLINDKLGHDAGDHLIKQLATRLRECLRESDTVGRLGGDEFVVLADDIADPNQVAGVAHKLLETVALPFTLSGREIRVTGSIGISIFPDDGGDAQALLKNADVAMYRAKAHGGNNFQFYSSRANSQQVQRLSST